IDIYLFDPSASPDDCPVYIHESSQRNRSASMPSKSEMRPWQTEEFEVAGQHWLLASVPTDLYPAQQGAWQPYGALIVGLLVTALSVGYVARAADRAERVEKIVTQRTAQLREGEQLLRELIDLQERERKLIAYDIHDGLAQQLTGALLRLQAFRPLQDADPKRIESTCNELKATLTECLSEARRLISGLRPPILDELGIVAAVDYLIDEQRQKDGPSIELRTDVHTDRFPPPLESAIFRIIQESLTNAVRYSQSEKVRVELVETNHHVHVEVQDWGIGFDPTGTTANRFGLQGIRERAKLFGGKAVIDSAPGKGTRISVDLPRLMRARRENA
ncbi:MAG TPA: sensor histidine kinase, partial [Thermoguttaceae bacterium]|nr:sensor histidine kinase [Thermoguttaceae bacterium]